jgi:acetyltransferase-like isoleucine patch superfamily enzyme
MNRTIQPSFFQHPSALVESTAVGAGTRIWAFAHVLKGARIGGHCNVGDHCFVEGGARIGDNVTIKNGVAIWDGVVVRDNVFVGPFAVFTNDLAPRSPRFPAAAQRYASKGWLSRTVVEEGASIGANATILCGLRIGRFAMIGAGTVVTRAGAGLRADGRDAGAAGRMGLRMRDTPGRGQPWRDVLPCLPLTLPSVAKAPGSPVLPQSPEHSKEEAPFAG